MDYSMVEYTRVIDVAMDQHKVTITIFHYVLLLVVCVHACMLTLTRMLN